MKLSTLIYILQHISWKTLYFNFKSFKFYIACKVPVFVNRKVVLKNIKGTIYLPQNIYAGIIKVGYGDVGIFDKQRSRTIWEVPGAIHFKGKADIGHGSKICVGKSGVLMLGKNFSITAESSIVCFHKISFGNACLLSWDVLMMDTDFHKVYSEQDILLNPDEEINIGNHVWIGAKCTVLKGSEIADNCMIAANSLITGKLTQPQCIYGGQPAKILKENVKWEV